MPPAGEAGKDYVRGGSVRVGDLVVVARSDGTLRFGEVLASAGAPGGRAFEICVAVDGEGRPDTVRVELGANLFRPTAAAEPAGGARLGSARKPGDRCAAAAKTLAEDRRQGAMQPRENIASAAKVAVRPLAPAGHVRCICARL